jgi:hypothetical protein
MGYMGFLFIVLEKKYIIIMPNVVAIAGMITVIGEKVGGFCGLGGAGIMISPCGKSG